MNDMNTRYLLAVARLASLGDASMWSPRDVADMFSVLRGQPPAVDFDTWVSRVAEVSGQQQEAPPPEPTPDNPDPQTTDTMNILLGPKGVELSKLGRIAISEVAVDAG